MDVLRAVRPRAGDRCCAFLARVLRPPGRVRGSAPGAHRRRAQGARGNGASPRRQRVPRRRRPDACGHCAVRLLARCGRGWLRSGAIPRATSVARSSGFRAWTRHNRRAVKIRAAVLEEFGAPLTVQELDLAEPKTGEVLVRLVACGVCHSDLYTASGADPSGYSPTVLGHEGAGVVERVGDGVSSVSPGDHVVTL